MDEPEPQRIDLNELRAGPIRHEALSPEILEQIGAVYGLLGPYLDKTLEQFEISFMRDTHPEVEAAIWCSIAAAWNDYHERFLDDKLLSDEQERKLIGALIAISASEDDLQKLPVSEEVGSRLRACYDGLGRK